MMRTRLLLITTVAVLVTTYGRTSLSSAQRTPRFLTVPSFKTTSGAYRIGFRAKDGAVLVTYGVGKAALAIREMGGDSKSNLLTSVTTVKHSGATYILSGKAKWATFKLLVTTFSETPGLVHIRLTVKPSHDAPSRAGLLPDIQLLHAPTSGLSFYSDAPPVAGTSLYGTSTALHSSILYFANLTALGPYFERTRSGGGQSFFSYPRAGGEGALVGVGRRNSFGYAPPPSSLGNLPHGKVTPVVDSFLYLTPTVPSGEGEIAAGYLQMLGTVFTHLPPITLPAADWKTLAAKTASDLLSPANLVTVNGLQYLRSYVSDTRAAPELITQAGALAGIRAYENRYHVTVPLDAVLERNLPSFFAPQFRTVTNGLGHDPNAREESWYYIGNLISLLQAAQQGSPNARKLLLDSADTAIKFAHINGYEFPQSYFWRDLNGKDSGLQPDVAGGYAWVMLGLYDLTKDEQYLTEARASIAHVAGKGFNLSYELHMTAYSAAAAQRLYTMTGDVHYRDDALLALANFFQSTRLWDCTYDRCHQGNGYHTVFGVNILPWGDYIAMREQYESWLGIRDYLRYASVDSPQIHSLVRAFIAGTPAILQYSLPPALPPGDVPSEPGLYSFVKHNNLTWNIPVEDLREGESQSGAIGQEIYGAGGPFVLAAYGP